MTKLLTYFGLLLSLMSLSVTSQQHQEPYSISQISPKSDSIFLESEEYFETSSNLILDPSKISTENDFLRSNDDGESDDLSAFNELHHQRMERSALPIINELSSRPSFTYYENNGNLEHFDSNDVESSGRYYQMINPTKINQKDTEYGGDGGGGGGGSAGNGMTQSNRMAKDLETERNSFLLKGGLRSVSGPPNIQTTVTPMVSIAIANNTGRQNQNPDIQDIITGIVKLLNGNVNVHANTQPSRRPVTTRINNRGPPRISDVQQQLPVDYDGGPPTSSLSSISSPSHRPQPPYPFERPEGPINGPPIIRPFLQGVPIPEQIVPSMQQNYRPGFVSQNRPPWQRPRPRPPITPNRRPFPYKPPMPQLMPEYHPEDEIQLTTLDTTDQNQNNNDEIDNQTEINNLNNNNINNYKIEVETTNDNDNDGSTNDDGNNDTDNIKNEMLPTTTTVEIQQQQQQQQQQKKKDEYPKKKDKNTNKLTDKKSVSVIQTTPTTIPLTEPLIRQKNEQQNSGDTIKTIIESSKSVIYTMQNLPSSHLVKPQSQQTDEDDDDDDDDDDDNSQQHDPSSISSSSSSSIVQSSFDDVTSNINTETPILQNSNNFTMTQEQLSTIATTSTTRDFIVPTTTNKMFSYHTTTTQSSQLPQQQNPNQSYHPRPGIVLDDPEFKPGGQGRPSQRPRLPIQPTKPPGYGEIFDVTLSAIQGPAGSGSKQTINIKPYGSYNQRPSGNGGGSGGGGTGNGDIIISPSTDGDDGFVSIDGKRTYINLFGEQTDAPTPSSSQTQISVKPTQVIPPGVTGSGYAVAETESPLQKQSHQQHSSNNRPPQYRPRPQQPPVRIDTCIVGDDSTCDQAQNEKCKTENGVSSCHCRPGFSRRKHREPCRKVVSLILSLRVDKIYERRIIWDKLLTDISSEAYGQLSYEAIRAIDSAMSMTPFSDEFIEAKVNKIYNGDAAQGTAGVFVNLTLMLEENLETLRPNLKADIQRHLLGVIHRRNNNIGNSALFVESPPGSISNLQDLDECTSSDLNDCHPEASCTNIWGSFRCDCPQGLRDPFFDQPQRAGRECHTCPESYCNNRGTCSYDAGGNQMCSCMGSYYGALCEIDGEVLGVAIGASVAAVTIIVLTLICLVMWSRRWHREQKNAISSPVFGYMTGAPVKTPSMGQAPYQVSLEDRMRWAQIADVMAQANHYGAEPVGSTRPSSAIFGYPTLQAIGNMNNLANMSNLGTMSLAGTLPIHSGTLPPVPLPRLGLHSRSSGMRTLENSSSSEEEDRTDLLGRNFHVPRPKSRSNGSLANQSGIYYDVDYEPSGDLYGGNHNNNNNTTNQIPMSTYTAGKSQSVYYMK